MRRGGQRHNGKALIVPARPDPSLGPVPRGSRTLIIFEFNLRQEPLVCVRLERYNEDFLSRCFDPFSFR